MNAISKAALLDASDTTIANFVDLTKDQIDFLGRTNAVYCYELMNTPDRISFNPAEVFPVEIQEREFVLLSQALRDAAATDRQRPAQMSEAELNELLERSLPQLSAPEYAALERMGFDALQARSDVEISAACNFVRAMIGEIAALPEEESALRFRQLLSASGAA